METANVRAGRNKNMEGSLRVLVVEDDPGMLKLITFLLKKNYYSVDVARYEVEVMNLMEKKKPGVIVIDVAHRGLDAVSLISRLKEEENTQDIPLLCISDKGNELKVMRALQEGAEAYIVKPFTPQNLLDKIVASMKKGD